MKSKPDVDMSLAEALRAAWQKIKQPETALDVTRGAMMGATTDTLGYPVDTMATALRAFGYDEPKPVGGSDWLADKFTSPTGSVAETTGRVVGGLFTPGPEDILRLAKVLPRKAPMQELITYHSSPHRINNVDEANPVGKFDLGKIGTGEGAQAYGHGIYVSEDAVMNRNHYYKKFGYDPKAVESSWYNGKELGKLPEKWSDVNAQEFAARALSDVPAGLSNDEKAARVIRAARKQYPDAPLEFEDVLDDAARKATANAVERRKGHFYTVDLPDEHIAKMLDWDAPLSEQPESVRKAVAAGMKEYKWPQAKIDDVLENSTGQQAYNYLMPSGNKSQASETLRKYGAPGIKYYDGGSRPQNVTDSRLLGLLEKNKGNVEAAVDEFMRGVYNTPKMKAELRADLLQKLKPPTRNFVIFDGDTAKILKRE